MMTGKDSVVAPAGAARPAAANLEAAAQRRTLRTAGVRADRLELRRDPVAERAAKAAAEQAERVRLAVRAEIPDLLNR